jgi:hypothetical protein
MKIFKGKALIVIAATISFFFFFFFKKFDTAKEGFIVPKSKREGRQDRRKPAVPRTNNILSEGGNRTRGL